MKCGDITLRKALDDYKNIYMPYRNLPVELGKNTRDDLQDFIGFQKNSGNSGKRGGAADCRAICSWT
jgi:hypothetical protein